WAGELVSFAGSQVTAVAVPVQVYALTRSSLDVGLLGMAALVPLVVSGLVGSTLADAVDRRRLALVTSTGLLVTSAALLAQAVAGGRSVWPFYLIVAVQASFAGVDGPARRTFIPRLLPPRLLPAAMALSQIGMNLALTLGPLVAGLLVAGPGPAYAYGLDVVSFFAALWSVFRLPAMPPLGGGTRVGLASVAEGMRFLRQRPVVLMTFAVDLVAMVFGMPRALFPALAAQRFHSGARVAGFLYSAVAAGALVGAAAGGWFGHVVRQGRAVLIAVAVWGGAVVGFGLTRSLALAVVFLAIAGAADLVSAVFRSTILQVATPDDLRGRMNGVFIAVVAGGPRLGDLEAGAVATAVSAPFSVISGGVACLAGVAVLALAAPGFRRYRGQLEPAPTAS
ncbi:MAG: MFS transporter, partial [Mycobacteriales bacterium]